MIGGAQQEKMSGSMTSSPTGVPPARHPLHTPGRLNRFHKKIVTFRVPRGDNTDAIALRTQFAA